MSRFLIVACLFTAVFVIQCQDEVVLDTDYTPATTAYTQLQAIIMKHQQFKERVKKNVSIEYSQCVDTIKTLRCNNIDQWQSVVEELKLENANSDEAEIPYLQGRKDSKVDLLKAYLNETAHENEVLADISGRLSENQKKIMTYYYYLDKMYKIPTPVETETFLIQQEESEEKPEEEKASEEPSAATMLNADVPDLAKEQLGQAKNEYDQADESIQAQTTSNMLKSYSKYTIQTLQNLEKTFDSRFGDLEEKKLKAKSDILKARSLISKEQEIKGRNEAKIAEMEGLIAACAGKPTNIEKDCEPLRVNASKVITEIDIIQTRSLLLNKELSKFIEENQNADQLSAHESQLTATAQAAQAQDEINYYLQEKEPAVEPRPIEELHPAHHFKENMPKEEKGEGEEGEEPAEQTAEKPTEEKPKSF